MQIDHSHLCIIDFDRFSVISYQFNRFERQQSKRTWTKILFHEVLSFMLEWVTSHLNQYTVLSPNWTDKYSLYTLIKIDHFILKLKRIKTHGYKTI